MDQSVSPSLISAPTCQRCLAWKRKTPDAGVCWHEDAPWYAATVSEHDSCERWAQKVITVKK